MCSIDRILFYLKRSLLEYALKHRIDHLVQKFAYSEKLSFSEYNISSIRFELYNMYILVKHKNFGLFDSVIQFLTEFQEFYSGIIDEKLYFRVLVSIKAMHIYECLRNSEMKKTFRLIKEYFPTENNLVSYSPGYDMTKKKKNSLEVKILTLRSEWNELILSKSKRETFFETQFPQRYDAKFFDFLLLKVNLIFEVINQNLPPTQLEEVMKRDFKEFNMTLFNTNELEFLDEEDEIRLELFIDNLKLHRIYLESQAQNIDHKYSNEYLRKIYKNLEEWQASVNDVELSQEASQACPSKKSESIIHEFLYMDSQQFDEIQTNESAESGLSEEISSRLKLSAIENLSKISNITNDMSTKSSDLTENHFSTGFSKELILCGNKLRMNTYENRNGRLMVTTDLLTDDEKDGNISV